MKIISLFHFFYTESSVFSPSLPQLPLNMLNTFSYTYMYPLTDRVIPFTSKREGIQSCDSFNIIAYKGMGLCSVYNVIRFCLLIFRDQFVILC